MKIDTANENRNESSFSTLDQQTSSEHRWRQECGKPLRTISLGIVVRDIAVGYYPKKSSLDRRVIVSYSYTQLIYLQLDFTALLVTRWQKQSLIEKKKKPNPHFIFFFLCLWLFGMYRKQIRTKRERISWFHPFFYFVKDLKRNFFLTLPHVKTNRLAIFYWRSVIIWDFCEIIERLNLSRWDQKHD